MGIDFTGTKEDFVNSDQRWIKTRMGRTNNRPITIDLAEFSEGHAPNGYIPSGILLSRLTAGDKLYVPFDSAGADGSQTAVGFLFESVKYHSTGRVACALYVGPGIIDTRFLPTFSGVGTVGSLTAGARTALAGGGWLKFED